MSIQTNLAMINSARTKAQNAEAIRAQAEAEAKASAERLASTRSTGFMSTEPEFGEDPLTELETRSIERDPGDRTPRFAAE